MSIAGRKPTPRKILELGGRVHRKKKNCVDFGEIDEKDFQEEIFSGLPPGALNRAKKTLGLLRAKSVLNPCDAEPFARYMQHLKIVYDADEIIRREGIISYDKNGVPHKHPVLQIHRDNSLAALRYEEQFGLTPSARTRLRDSEDIKEDREVSSFNDFIEQREE